MSSRSSSASIEFEQQQSSQRVSPERRQSSSSVVIQAAVPSPPIPPSRPIGKILSALQTNPPRLSEGGSRPLPPKRASPSPKRGANGKQPPSPTVGDSPKGQSPQFVPIPLIAPPVASKAIPSLTEQNDNRLPTPTRGPSKVSAPKVPPSRGSPRRADVDSQPKQAIPAEWQSSGTMALSGSVNLGPPPPPPSKSTLISVKVPTSRPPPLLSKSTSPPLKNVEDHQGAVPSTIPGHQFPLPSPTSSGTPMDIRQVTDESQRLVSSEASIRLEDNDVEAPRLGHVATAQSAFQRDPEPPMLTKSASSSSSLPMLQAGTATNHKVTVDPTPPIATPKSTRSPSPPTILRNVNKSPMETQAPPALDQNASFASTVSFAALPSEMFHPPVDEAPQQSGTHATATSDQTLRSGPIVPPKAAAHHRNDSSNSIIAIEEAGVLEHIAHPKVEVPTEFHIPTAQHRSEDLAKKSVLRPKQLQEKVSDAPPIPTPVPLQVPTPPVASASASPQPSQPQVMNAAFEHQLRHLLRQHGYGQVLPLPQTTEVRHRSPPLGAPPLFQNRNSTSPERLQDASAGAFPVLSPETNSPSSRLASLPKAQGSPSTYTQVPFDQLSNLTTDASHLVSSPQPHSALVLAADPEAIAEEAEDQKGLLRYQLRTAGDHLAKLTRMYNMLNQHNDGIEDEFARIQTILDTLRSGVTMALRDEVRTLRTDQQRMRDNTVAQLTSFYSDVQKMMIEVVEATSSLNSVPKPIASSTKQDSSAAEQQRVASASLASSLEIRPLKVAEAPLRRSPSLVSQTGSSSRVPAPSQVPPKGDATTGISIDDGSDDEDQIANRNTGSVQQFMVSPHISYPSIDQAQLQEYIHKVAIDMAHKLSGEEQKRLRRKARAMRDHARRLATELRTSNDEARALRDQLNARDHDFALYLKDVKESYHQQLVTCEEHILTLRRQLQIYTPSVHYHDPSMGHSATRDPFADLPPKPETHNFAYKTPHSSNAPFEDVGPNHPPPLPPRSSYRGASTESYKTSLTNTSMQHATQRLLSAVSTIRKGGSGGKATGYGGAESHQTDVVRQGLWAEQLLGRHKVKVPALVDRSIPEKSNLEVTYVSRRAKKKSEKTEDIEDTSAIEQIEPEREVDLYDFEDNDSCLDNSSEDSVSNLDYESTKPTATKARANGKKSDLIGLTANIVSPQVTNTSPSSRSPQTNTSSLSPQTRASLLHSLFSSNDDMGPSPHARHPEASTLLVSSGGLSPQQRQVLEEAASRSAKRRIELQESQQLIDRAHHKTKEKEAAVQSATTSHTSKEKQKGTTSGKLFRKPSKTITDLAAAGTLPPTSSIRKPMR